MPLEVLGRAVCYNGLISVVERISYHVENPDILALSFRRVSLSFKLQMCYLICLNRGGSIGSVLQILSAESIFHLEPAEDCSVLGDFCRHARKSIGSNLIHLVENLSS